MFYGVLTPHPKACTAMPVHSPHLPALLLCLIALLQGLLLDNVLTPETLADNDSMSRGMVMSTPKHCTAMPAYSLHCVCSVLLCAAAGCCC
jgi:hypothetical protein